MFDISRNIWELFSASWFFPSTLTGFVWTRPVFLYLIPFLPVVFLFRKAINRSERLKIAVSVKPKSTRLLKYLRLIPTSFIFLSLTMVLLALAGPQRINESADQTSEGIDIMLVLDVSESMGLKDIVPDRLEAAKSTALEFIRKRKNDRIGIIVFSGEAYSLTPSTTDRILLEESIREVRYGMIPETGTALGNALSIGISRLTQTDAKGKVLILISDGDSNAGSIDPLTAAELAKTFHVSIYTVSIGKPGQENVNRPDESSLAKIAEISKGKFFRAGDNKALTDVFNTIDEYERIKFQYNRFQSKRDYYPVYLCWSILFLLAYIFCKNTPLSAASED